MASSDDGKRGLETADDYYAVTPNNSVDLSPIPRALLIAVAGNIHIQKTNGVEVTLTVPAGYFAGRVKRLYASDTTASGFTAMV